ncbi:hypothetical protein F4809DRAFT_595148 [Biscogniauxia mediterranea]|nr:hypothetical protein F4809DRAFT_595148 [Biscogniauxia mediterranea]
MAPFSCEMHACTHAHPITITIAKPYFLVVILRLLLLLLLSTSHSHPPPAVLVKSSTSLLNPSLRCLLSGGPNVPGAVHQLMKGNTPVS